MIYELNIQTYGSGSVDFDDFEVDTDEEAREVANDLIDNWEDENDDLSYRWHLNEKETNRNIAV